MATIAEALSLAVQYHQAGQLQQAEAIYLQILQGDPTNADALHLLGLIAHQVGKNDQAVQYLKRAIGVKPDFAEAHNSLGIALKMQGQLAEAITQYREALRLKPDFPDVHNNLGIALKADGQLAEAVAHYQEAVRLKPGYAEAHKGLGNVLTEQGQLAEAAAQYQQALHFKPDDAEALNNLGNVLKKQGKLDEAVAHYRQALRFPATAHTHARTHSNLGNVFMEQSGSAALAEAVIHYRQAVHLKPDHVEAYNNLGNALGEQGQLAEAVLQYQQALRLKPDFAEAHNNLANALKQQGTAAAWGTAQRADRLAEAVTHFQQALRLKPGFAEAHNNLGNVLKEQADSADCGTAQRAAWLAEAVEHYQEAVRLKPDFAEAYTNLGNVLKDQGRLAEAVEQYQEAVRRKPDYAEAHYNQGIALKDHGHLAEALAQFDAALRLVPDHAEAHFGRAAAWLLAGDFEQGWREYEWRWHVKDGIKSKRSFAQPLWDGTPLTGKTILLHAEQGLGDTLQFVRYAALVKRHGGRVIVECQQRLLRILARCDGIDQLVGRGSPLPEFDVHAPLLSLPWILGTTSTTVTAKIPYLEADPGLVASWRKRLAGYEGFKVGVNWRGRPDNPSERLRGIPARHLAPLARLPEVCLISLQKDQGWQEIGEVADQFRLVDLGRGIDEAAGPFMDTAAILQCLDLILTSDTAITHLAGALGVPVWVALPLAPDWRWLLDREDCPWYPNMRLFRQRRWGDWEEVFERIVAEVQKLLVCHRELKT